MGENKIKNKTNQQSIEALREEYARYEHVIQWYQQLCEKFPLDQIAKNIDRLYLSYLGSEDADKPEDRIVVTMMVRELIKLSKKQEV